MFSDAAVLSKQQAHSRTKNYLGRKTRQVSVRKDLQARETPRRALTLLMSGIYCLIQWLPAAGCRTKLSAIEVLASGFTSRRIPPNPEVPQRSSGGDKCGSESRPLITGLAPAASSRDSFSRRKRGRSPCLNTTRAEGRFNERVAVCYYDWSYHFK